MDKKENELLIRLQAMFKIEAAERLRSLSSGLLELEKTPAVEKQTAIVEVIYREAHSLKGAARAVNMSDIEAICQSLENVFAALKRRELSPSSKLFDTLHHAVDTIEKLLSTPGDGWTLVSELTQQLENIIEPLEDGPHPEEKVQYFVAQPKIEDFSQNDEKSSGAPTKEADSTDHYNVDKPVLSETVRISTAKLDSLFLQAEDMLSVKLAAIQRAAEFRDIKSELDRWEKEWAKIYPAVRTVRRLLEKEVKQKEQGQTGAQFAKLLEFIDWSHTYVKLLQSKVKTLVKSADQEQWSFSANIDNFLEDMKKTLMLPFSSLLEAFPKMVREMSRAQGKEIDLLLHGSEVEIDKRILVEMKDPLIHLLRNCIDHGIEEPAERELNNKPPCGTVTVAISQVTGNKVEILIADDGAGIDLAQVQEAALKRGIISKKEADKLNDQELLSLIFQSEVSTSPIITDISGRGLGLAIVQEKVEKLRGLISVETKPQAGSLFRITLPLTMATFRGILIRVSGQVFVVPTANVEQVIRIKPDEIKNVENKETILLNGRTVAYVRLNDILEIPGAEKENEGRQFIRALVLCAGEKRIAFRVDEVMDEQEVLVKNLGKQLARVRNIGGATVLGSGKVVPILNVSDLIKSAVKNTFVSGVAAAAAVEEKIKSILIVEDSITSRMLLKNIVESAGYRVKTAVDGVEALMTLKTQVFDLVVSDIEMPRMDGFALTAGIRADEKFSHLPVVLVTSLESREARERGIDAGANAYIVKSSFDHSNLLEVIRRLI